MYLFILRNIGVLGKEKPFVTTIEVLKVDTARNEGKR